MPRTPNAGAVRPLDPFVAHCLELLGSVGRTRSRAMFGGHGLYVDDLFVAVIVEERLYLKTNAATEAAFRGAGCEPWIYTGADKPMPMAYWSVPAEAMDSPALMAPWARLATQAALAAAAAKAAKKTKKAGAGPAVKAGAKPASATTTPRRRGAAKPKSAR